MRRLRTPGTHPQLHVHFSRLFDPPASFISSTAKQLHDRENWPLSSLIAVILRPLPPPLSLFSLTLFSLHPLALRPPLPRLSAPLLSPPHLLYRLALPPNRAASTSIGTLHCSKLLQPAPTTTTALPDSAPRPAAPQSPSRELPSG